MIIAVGVMKFGDSARATRATMKVVTFGTSLTERGGWQEPLRAALSRCMDRPVDVETVARSGATSDWAVEQVGRVVAFRPDVVLVELYANDAAFYRSVSLSRSRDNLRFILDRLKTDLPEARIVLMAMNPISGIRGFARPWIDNYIEAHRRLALERNFEFLDHRPGWKALSDIELDEAIPDGVHPRAEVAAAVMVPSLAALVALRPCRG